MRQALQLVEDNQAHRAPFDLPQLATPNDVRVVVHYLKKNPRGVTPDEAADAVKRQAFEPLKIADYEALGLTKRNGNRIQLDGPGLELAQKLEPEIEGFRAILNRIEAYHAVLDWAHRQDLDCLLYGDIARYWRDNFQDALGICAERTLESYVACFLQLCQAAALGAYISGRKGQPTRLRLDRNELQSYLNTPIKVNGVSVEEQRRALKRLEPFTALETQTIAPSPTFETEAESFRVLISHSGNNHIAELVSSALETLDVESSIVQRANDGAPFISEVLQAMRHCNAAIIVFSKEDFEHEETNKLALKNHVQVELGAALVHFDKRAILLAPEGMHLPDGLVEIPSHAYSANELSWTTGLQLIKSVKSFRQKISAKPI